MFLENLEVYYTSESINNRFEQSVWDMLIEGAIQVYQEEIEDPNADELVVSIFEGQINYDFYLDGNLVYQSWDNIKSLQQEGIL
ncbi:hypothetical protein [Oceanotoga phage vB_OteS-UFV02]